MIMQDSVGYCGFVTIKKMKGRKIIAQYDLQNNGTAYLFQVLAGTLCGYDKLNDIPKYLDLGYTDTDDATYTPAIPYRAVLASNYIENLTITSGDEKTLIKVGAKFNVNIPVRSMLRGAKVNTFALYSGKSQSDNRTTKLAEVRLDTDITDLTANSNYEYSYAIEWIMTFSNQVKSVLGGEN